MVAIIMFSLFRRLSAALLPIAVVLTSLVATFGAMAMLDIPFSIPTQIVPSFLIAVGVCDSVHILTIFFQAWDRGETREACVVQALGHSGLAVVLTSLTTAAGLLSFLSAEIAPVTRLGTIAPIGVLLTLFYTLTMLPALLVLAPIKPKKFTTGEVGRGQPNGSGRLTALLVGVGDRMAANPRVVVAVAALVVLAATTGVVKLRFSHDPTGWLLPDDPVRVAVERMDEALKGVSVVEILIDTGLENGLHDPDTLRRIEAAAAYAESLTDGPVPVGKATSIRRPDRELRNLLRGPDDRDRALWCVGIHRYRERISGRHPALARARDPRSGQAIEPRGSGAAAPECKASPDPPYIRIFPTEPTGSTKQSRPRLSRLCSTSPLPFRKVLDLPGRTRFPPSEVRNASIPMHGLAPLRLGALLRGEGLGRRRVRRRGPGRGAAFPRQPEPADRSHRVR